MKKSFAFACAFLLLAVLCACVHTPTMDLSGFLLQRKRLGAPLDVMRLYQTAGDSGCTYFIPLTDNLSLRLLCLTTGEIYECRVLLRKMNTDGSILTVDSAMMQSFEQECRNVLCGFGSFSADEVDVLSHQLQLSDPAVHRKTGTNTVNLGHFTVQLQLHPLESVFAVRNDWLMETETTLLPESAPLFDDTTATRKETVPHR